MLSKNDQDFTYEVETAIEDFIMTGNNDFGNCSRSCIRDMILEVAMNKVKEIIYDQNLSEELLEQKLQEIPDVNHWIDKALNKKTLSMSEKLRDVGLSDQDFYQED